VLFDTVTFTSTPDSVTAAEQPHGQALRACKK
jgi:hypothetical protein